MKRVHRFRCWWPGLLAVLLVGCWDAKELEQVIYINALGFDYQKDVYSAYAQVINFANLGKTTTGTRTPEEVWVGRGYGHTVDSSTDNLFLTVQQRISWAHIKGVLLSERVLQHGRYDQLFDAYVRYPEIRFEQSLFATRDSIEQVLTATPLLHISSLYTRFINPHDTYNQNSDVAPISLREFIKRLEEPSCTIVLPYLKVNDTRWRRNMKDHRVMEADGVGFIKNKKYKGTLEPDQVKGLRWVQKESIRSTVCLFEGKKAVASLSLIKPDRKTTFRMQDGKPRFTVTIKAAGKLVESLEYKSEHQLTALAAQQVEKEVRELFLEGVKMQTDVLGLEETLYRAEPKLWQRLTQGQDLVLEKQTLEKIDVKVSLRGTGKLQMKTNL
ncbi:Ger(x)C family germination protein [Tumebacillus sp. BK434]|uniref:Ger(x)C family spore germination protein n=1 Tax=Tumebacillus sp. BK434 TaxID=2512169 RepID=UPI001052EB76|nr:Ger(x)C family spore germination protein [Tumebacillus sp. BK434]TCP59582.1 Ger(x)C family germination protein [Tumebacillus sp. BK434]